jgi:hypothetical protein
VIEARKMGHSERSLEQMHSSRRRMLAFEKMGTVNKRSPEADAALGRIMYFLEQNRLKMADLFNLIDADDSDYIDAGELYTELTRLGMEITESEATDVCDSMDVDGDGTVERGEFFKRYKELSRERRRANQRARRASATHRFRSLGPDWQRGRVNVSQGRHGVWRAAQYSVAAEKAVAQVAVAGAAAVGAEGSWSHGPRYPAPGGEGASPPPAMVAEVPEAGGQGAPGLLIGSSSSSNGRGALGRRPQSAYSGSQTHVGHTQRRRPQSAAPQMQTVRGGSRPVSAPSSQRPTSAAAAASRLSMSRQSKMTAHEVWTGSYEDVLLMLLDKHKLKLSDLFRQIDADGSGECV